MKSLVSQKCANCSQMIDVGRSLCTQCQEKKAAKTNASQKARNQAMRDLGLTKVRGALGGTYWE